MSSDNNDTTQANNLGPEGSVDNTPPVSPDQSKANQLPITPDQTPISESGSPLIPPPTRPIAKWRRQPLVVVAIGVAILIAVIAIIVLAVKNISGQNNLELITDTNNQQGGIITDTDDTTRSICHSIKPTVVKDSTLLFDGGCALSLPMTMQEAYDNGWTIPSSALYEEDHVLNNVGTYSNNPLETKDGEYSIQAKYITNSDTSRGLANITITAALANDDDMSIANKVKIGMDIKDVIKEYGDDYVSKYDGTIDIETCLTTLENGRSIDNIWTYYSRDGVYVEFWFVKSSITDSCKVTTISVLPTLDFNWYL
jgi:hypothetical protein